MLASPHHHSTTATPGDARAAKRLFPSGNLTPFFLVTVLFFLWAIPNNLNDVLIRQFMKSFALSRLQAGFVQSAFYLGYFVMALPAAFFMRRLGYKAGCIMGLVLFGSGALLFWPAALAGRYSFFLIALFVIASGLSFLETTSNSFIALCGDPETSERRLNFAQSFNPLGSITGVLIGTVFIFSGVELSPHSVQALQAAHKYAAYSHFETMRVIRPYVVLGIVTLIWAALIALVKFPKLRDERAQEVGERAHARDLVRNPHFSLAVLAQFLYVGAQVGTWSYFIQYVESYAHQPEKVAGYLLTGSLVAFAAGRFVSTYLMKFFNPSRLMGAYSLINVALAFLGVAWPGWIGMWALFLTSFFMSLMFPTIFALGLRGLGASTKFGGSVLVMAIVGGAVLTPLMGWISELSSVSLAYVVPLVAYAYVAFYSFAGPRILRASMAETAPLSTG